MFDAPCVCGHARSAHRGTRMSVPLVGRAEPRSLGPILPLAAKHITDINYRATYFSDNCSCGCTIYQPDLADQYLPLPIGVTT